MPRRRDLDPGFFKNDDLGSLSPLARLFFAGLWCYADREGRLEDRPARLKAEILPYDQCSGEEMVQQLIEIGMIERYESGGVKVLLIVNFLKHQSHIHPKEERTKLPAPPDTTKDESGFNLGNTQDEPKDDQGDTKDRRRKPSYSRYSRTSRYSHNSRSTLEPNGSCVEQEKSCPAPPTPDAVPFSELPDSADDPIITLPCIGKKHHAVSQADVDHYAELYPAVDIMQQLRCMVGWLESNPTRLKKSGKGVKSFITGWLGREQNRGGAYRAGTGPPGRDRRAVTQHTEITKNPFDDG